MRHVESVQQIYDAFGRGDIPTIIGHLHEDVQWDYAVTDAGVPWLRPGQGLAHVRTFFESLGALEFKHFQPKTLLEAGPIVVALIDITFEVKATGRTVSEEDEVHIWRFGPDGKVNKFTHKLDTYQHWAAFRGQ